MSKKNASNRIQFVKKFGTRNDDLTYNPAKKLYKFYQICSFKNPTTGKHDVRIIKFNEMAEIVKKQEYICTPEYCNTLLSKADINQYKIYPTYDIDLVGLPDMDDMLKFQSPLLR